MNASAQISRITSRRRHNLKGNPMIARIKIGSRDTLNVKCKTESRSQTSAPPEQPTTNSKNYVRPAFDKGTVLPQFRAALSEIFDLGKEITEVEEEFRTNIQDRAIAGLAKILEVRRAYFDSATPEISKVLLDDLYQQCKNHGLKGRTIRTTEFHLLSRLLRNSDRKQASADAKILIRAHNEGQTSETFPEWVKKLNGLSAIRKDIESHEKGNRSSKARNELAHIKRQLYASVKKGTGFWSSRLVFPFDGPHDTWTELLPEDNSWTTVLVKREGNQVKLYALPADDSDSRAST
ncbi:hypothetical protein [Burkholderia multivorans]|uniref:hypothetical protein n=1 Tax=Burkholderia multivorans TaxID=87883 RepID=UPI0011B1ED37|nr:hypothetical protein [Burkholderia multivorans]